MSKYTPGRWESLDDIVRVDDFGSQFHHIEVCRFPTICRRGKRMLGSLPRRRSCLPP